MYKVNTDLDDVIIMAILVGESLEDDDMPSKRKYKKKHSPRGKEKKVLRRSLTTVIQGVLLNRIVVAFWRMSKRSQPGNLAKVERWRQLRRDSCSKIIKGHLVYEVSESWSCRDRLCIKYKVVCNLHNQYASYYGLFL